MADFGVDRYGKPMGYDQQANPYKQRPAAPGTQAPQPQQPQDVNNGATAQQPQHAVQPVSNFAQMQHPAQPMPMGQPQAGPSMMAGIAAAGAGLAHNLPNTGVSGYGQGGQPAPQPQAPAAPPTQGTYAPIQGFDFDKLRGARPYDSADKYSDAVRAFSQGLGSGVQVSRNNLGGMVDYAHSHGFGNANSVGDDKIDFGDGRGPIDVIQSNGSIWFQNGPDRFGGAAPHGAPMGAPSPTSYVPPPQAAQALQTQTGAPIANGGAANGAGQLPTTPLPTYTPATISQFAAPQNQDVEASQKGLLQQLLANPHSMSDQNVNQLKQQSIEEQMAMQKQLQAQMGQQFASHNMSNSGALDAGNRRLGESLGASVLGSNRAIDLQKMQQDRTDELGALGAANDVLSGQMGRATQGYNTGLAGQMAQAGENQTGFNSQADAVKFALQNALSQQQLNQGSRGLDLQGQQISNQNAQFGLSNDLANRQFADAMQQWRARLGYDYNQGALNANQSFWQ